MFKNEAEFVRRIASASLSDTHNAYDGYGNMDEDTAHAALQLIQGRMEALMAFLNALEFPEVAPVVTPSVSTIVLEKDAKGS